MMESIIERKLTDDRPQTLMLNRPRSRLTAILALVVSLLVLYASLRGVLDKHLYIDAIAAGVLSKSLLAAIRLQDQLSIPFAVTLLIVSVSHFLYAGYKTFLVLLGLVGNFLYAYGLFVISGNFTAIYLVYLVIFGLSIYSLIFGLTSFEPEVVRYLQLPVLLRNSISLFLLVIVFIFVFLWVNSLTPLISKHIRPDTYAVFILDLCIVMPGLAITAVQLLRRIPFGNVLVGIFLIKILTLILPVAIGEILLSTHTKPTDYSMAAIYSLIVFISLFLSVHYLLKLRLTK
ncbi:hypothetical protein G8759_22100 [Spirosoma aureum]|uniref:Uncharacterized protein n=1 Tax=Spirosoma aureum TaxID=2692134 RepID=A0A6G9ARM1_9BACT|nr:hypothetical protein [Spirosoma aureum]QIP15121.1 hypothetical protein G8759_22100 [Spirosoma aureum]